MGNEHKKHMLKYDIEPFKEITVALNTPFMANEEIDVEGTKKLVRYMKNKGVKSLYVCGSTGEGFLLSIEERKQIVEAAIEAAGDDMKIIVHVGTASTKLSAHLAEHAQSVGADAISAVPSVYYRLGEESVFQHWTKIMEASDLPFIIYNIPQLTGFNLSMPLFQRLIENEKVIGIKCSSEPAHDIMRFKQAGGKEFLVFNGPDEQYLAGRVMGADAGIGGTYGAMPELYIALEKLIRKGEIDKAIEAQKIITDFVYRLCSFESLYGAVKAILKLDGCDIGNPRLPFLPVSTENLELIKLYSDIQTAKESLKNM
ncbi:dihydrodipicolinate synthase family protein [Vallitaleaceae bacterium 9-2]